MPLAPYWDVRGEMISPAYTGLNQLGITEANYFYNEFNSKNKSTKVLEKYLSKLEPKNILDKLFYYGTAFDTEHRITKRAAVKRILMEREE